MSSSWFEPPVSVNIQPLLYGSCSNLDSFELKYSSQFSSKSCSFHCQDQERVKQFLMRLIIIRQRSDLIQLGPSRKLTKIMAPQQSRTSSLLSWTIKIMELFNQVRLTSLKNAQVLLSKDNWYGQNSAKWSSTTTLKLGIRQDLLKF